VRGIESHFWLLGDQIRDWGIALRPFHELPLVGPATHVGGYTIGPAYYWIMWAIRVLVGPWFDNLPHAGGYGQAAIESAADALLFVALWRRVQSPWVALAAAIVIVTSGFDVALSAIDWTPPIASAPASGNGSYLVQVSSQRSEADAQSAYRSIQSKYPSVLGSQPHTVRRADLGSKGVYYRAMVGPFPSREAAVQLCSSLKQAGGDCVVQH